MCRFIGKSYAVGPGRRRVTRRFYFVQRVSVLQAPLVPFRFSVLVGEAFHRLDGGESLGSDAVRFGERLLHFDCVSLRENNRRRRIEGLLVCQIVS